MYFVFVSFESLCSCFVGALLIYRYVHLRSFYVPKFTKIQMARAATKLGEILKYRKIPKISPSKYKPPKPVTQRPSIKSPLQI